ncbi:MATE family efflux transporter [Streptomyces albipurpureus]|uniref:Probable multidrug resistance protein NorM n=1 Tax=Streptomyces albipurpureus TaxID=2897419 RepID=A0ABT0UI41_9ACTN|nr:MATE family efflux transporter [Streptomyces sp. CWNU-1]MCM2386981.1 MATE family efflux transporter [Streptomyces sp. CWNU-1]
MSKEEGTTSRINLVGRIAGSALPLYVTMVGASAGAVVDTVMLGRHSTASLAAFAVTIAVYSPATAAVTGVLRGVMPFAAEYQDDPGRLAPLIRHGTWLGLSVGALGASAVGCVGVMGELTGVSRSVLSELGVFPLVMALSVISTAVGAPAISVLVALGQGKAVMRAGLSGTACSVVLSVVLIGGTGPWPALGLTGAGIALLTSSLVTVCQVQRSLRSAALLPGMSWWPGRPDIAGMARLARVGAPLAGTVLIKFTVLGVLTFAAARLGTDKAAAHGVSETLVNLLYIAAVAVGQAMVPVISGAVHNADIAQARRGVLAGVAVALCAVGTLGSGLLLAGPWVVALFSSDVSLRPSLMDQLLLVWVVVLADALQAVVGFGMLGLRKTFPSMVSTLVVFGALAVLAVPIADSGGLEALWMALAAANLLQALVKSALFYRHTRELPADRARAGV